MVATPLYDGAQYEYLRAILGLVNASQRRGVDCAFSFVANNASIALARDLLVGSFLGSQAQFLVFVDNDIGFDPEALIGLVDLMAGDERLGIVGAPCPKRQVNWEMVAAAAARGLADGAPAELERFSGAFTLELADPQATFRVDQPVEVTRIGTGLLAIRREVILDLVQRHPELRFSPDPHDRLPGMVEGLLTALFHPLIETPGGRLLSEDFSFCHRARAAGHRIWAAPWLRSSHTGPARFTGALADLARLSAAPSPSPA
jgi:hypothetical protein